MKRNASTRKAKEDTPTRPNRGAAAAHMLGCPSAEYALETETWSLPPPLQWKRSTKCDVEKEAAVKNFTVTLLLSSVATWRLPYASEIEVYIRLRAVREDWRGGGVEVDGQRGGGSAKGECDVGGEERGEGAEGGIAAYAGEETDDERPDGGDEVGGEKDKMEEAAKARVKQDSAAFLQAKSDEGMNEKWVAITQRRCDLVENQIQRREKLEDMRKIYRKLVQHVPVLANGVLDG
ncbi:hypothetical protein B0H19DRAFT_1077168 [Mycena capillaripes]|nr:hypothetical protein B0H19DRAFT_1077168 [Mycena capillaripes]